ncbi:MAG: hypothetical protein R2809_13890 [Flavobacteriales bacterium]
MRFPSFFLVLLISLVSRTFVQAQSNDSTTYFFLELMCPFQDSLELQLEDIDSTEFIQQEEIASKIEDSMAFYSEKGDSGYVATSYKKVALSIVPEYSGFEVYLGYFPEINMHLIAHYGECASGFILLDHQENRVTALPCAFDQGIINFQISPNEKKLMWCAGYDMFQFSDYYEYLTEVYIMDLEPSKKGMESFQRIRHFVTNDITLHNAFWSTDNRLFLSGETADEVKVRKEVVE